MSEAVSVWAFNLSSLGILSSWLNPDESLKALTAAQTDDKEEQEQLVSSPVRLQQVFSSSVTNSPFVC